jgi:hypothetical protein
MRYTRRVSIQALLTILALIAAATGLQAGEYHSLQNGTLYCDECHTFGAAPGDEAGGTDPAFPPAGSGDGASSLLKAEGNAVCLACHDGNPKAIDVVGRNTGRDPSMVREAGALNRVGGALPYREGNGHTLGLEAPAPGSRPPWTPEGGLKCVDCHDPHGAHPLGNPYRNLLAAPGNRTGAGTIVTYSVGSNDPSRDVFVRRPGGYAAADVDFNEPFPGGSSMADFCQGCHTEFHGARGGIEVGGAMATGWIRHPAGDADIGRAGGRHSSRRVFSGEWTTKRNYVKVMTNTGNWSPASSQEVTDHSPTCLSCHKAHGNMNPFGLIYMGNEGTITEEGTPDGRYVDLCRQCHSQSITDPSVALR